MKTNRAVPPEGKVTYYKPNGTGRDSYIRDINGGLLSHDQIHALKIQKPPKEKPFNFGKTAYNKHPWQYKSATERGKFNHYTSDGSGRDFYITSNEGGNSFPFRWRNQTDFRYKNGLRNHSSLCTVNCYIK